MEVEVVDANLTYNLNLGRSWTYAMRSVASSLFRVIRFPHQGKIVLVDQLSFLDSSSEGNVPFVVHTSIPVENVGVGLFKDPALMGVFSLPPPNLASIGLISTRSDSPLHTVATLDPFSKGGIDYLAGNPRSAGGHGQIISTVDHFIK